MTRDWIRGYDPFYLGGHIFAWMAMILAGLGVIAMIVEMILHGVS